MHSGGNSSWYVPVLAHARRRRPGAAAGDARGRCWPGTPTTTTSTSTSPGTASSPVEAERQGKIVITTELGGGGHVPAPSTGSPSAGSRTCSGTSASSRARSRRAPRSGCPTRSSSTRRDPRNYLIAPESGLFEALVDPGDPVAAGQPVGALHFLERPDRPPAPIRAPLDGVIVSIRAISSTEQGDNVIGLGQPIDAARSPEHAARLSCLDGAGRQGRRTGRSTTRSGRTTGSGSRSSRRRCTSRETLVPWIVSHVEPGARILDIGGGSGYYASKIVRAAPVTVVGLDISSSMIEQRQADPLLTENVVGDMEDLPFEDGELRRGDLRRLPPPRPRPAPGAPRGAPRAPARRAAVRRRALLAARRCRRASRPSPGTRTSSVSRCGSSSTERVGATREFRVERVTGESGSRSRFAATALPRSPPLAALPRRRPRRPRAERPARSLHPAG